MIQPPLMVRAAPMKSASRNARPARMRLASGLDLIAIQFRENPLRLVIFVRLVFIAFQHCAGGRHRGRNRASQLEDGFVSHRRAFLRQEADRHSFFDGHPSFIGRRLTEDQRKKRGFAGAIRSDQTKAITAVNLQGHVLEESAPRVRFGNLSNSEHRTAATVAVSLLLRKSPRSDDISLGASANCCGARFERLASLEVQRRDCSHPERSGEERAAESKDPAPLQTGVLPSKDLPSKAAAGRKQSTLEPGPFDSMPFAARSVIALRMTFALPSHFMRLPAEATHQR